MLTSAIKKQTSVCCSISLNPYNMVFQTWKSGITKKKKEKRKAILLLAIADVSCLTNCRVCRVLCANIVFNIIKSREWKKHKLIIGPHILLSNTILVVTFIISPLIGIKR